MKYIRKIVISALLLLVILASNQAEARESTAYTYTISVDGEWIRTQDVLTGAVYLKDGMSKLGFVYQR